MKVQKWSEALAPFLPKVVETRRFLHRHPEVSGTEENTCAFIQRELAAMGLETRLFKDCHSVMGILRGGQPGKTAAIRADIDALPVTEETGLPFASEKPGVMHACGHDAHTAIALGTAAYWAVHRADVHGTIKFFFESEEETRGGARLMVEQGCLEDPKVDFVLGQHMNPHYAAGTFFAKPGFVSGSSDEVRLTIRGKSCHGAYPESGVDAIVLTAQVVTALQTLVSRTISPLDSAVLTLGTIQGGTANNIVCGEVKLRGTLRTLSDATRAALKDRICQTVEGICAAMGGEGVAEISPGYGAVYNDDALYQVVETQAKNLLGDARVVTRDAPSLGVESFGYFQKDTPGVYWDIGSGIGTALHTGTFCVDEDCLLPAVALQCAALEALMK